MAQGLFRNPLADPYLLGSAAGASLAVALVLAGSALAGPAISLAAAQGLARLGLVAAAFVGALVGVLLTLALARGAQQTLRLLLAGVVVGVMLGAMADLVATMSPAALRGRQLFLLGSTGFLGWGSVALLAAGLALALPLAWRLARVLDALTLGEDSAASLGLPLPRLRLVLVLILALATGLAVSQAGLVAFVGLAAPHLVRRFAPAPQGFTLLASAAAGGVLLLAADVLARGLIAPRSCRWACSPPCSAAATCCGCCTGGAFDGHAASRSAAGRARRQAGAARRELPSCAGLDGHRRPERRRQVDAAAGSGRPAAARQRHGAPGRAAAARNRSPPNAAAPSPGCPSSAR